MANTYTQIYLKFVFAIENRISLIKSTCKDELYKYITGIVQTNKHKLIVINGIPNHIHIFISQQSTYLLGHLSVRFKNILQNLNFHLISPYSEFEICYTTLNSTI